MPSSLLEKQFVFKIKFLVLKLEKELKNKLKMSSVFLFKEENYNLVF